MRAESRQSACCARAGAHWHSAGFPLEIPPTTKPYPIQACRQAEICRNFRDPYIQQADIMRRTALDDNSERPRDRPELHLLARFDQVTVHLHGDRLIRMQHESGQIMVQIDAPAGLARGLL